MTEDDVTAGSAREEGCGNENPRGLSVSRCFLLPTLCADVMWSPRAKDLSVGEIIKIPDWSKVGMDDDPMGAKGEA